MQALTQPALNLNLSSLIPFAISFDLIRMAISDTATFISRHSRRVFELGFNVGKLCVPTGFRSKADVRVQWQRNSLRLSILLRPPRLTST